MIDIALMEKLDNTPLSQAVMKLLKDQESGRMHLEQFMMEMMEENYQEPKVTRYWKFMMQKAMALLENFMELEPRRRWKALTVNQNLHPDENKEMIPKLLEAAQKQDRDLLFEYLMDNLTSNYDLEPSNPELL